MDDFGVYRDLAPVLSQSSFLPLPTRIREGNLGGATLADYWTSSTFVPNPAYK
jgi:hypothetical protein